jgi:hypothetical protein
VTSLPVFGRFAGAAGEALALMVLRSRRAAKAAVKIAAATMIPVSIRRFVIAPRNLKGFQIQKR